MYESIVLDNIAKEVNNMKKTLPIIISVSAGIVLSTIAVIGFRNSVKNIKQASATEYTISFTYESIIDDMSEMYGDTFAFVSFEKQTPKGNMFGLYDLGQIGGDQSVSYKTNNHIFTISDSNANGYFSFVFKFNLEMATFDHITFLGSFTTKYENPETTSHVTYNQLDDSNGLVTCCLSEIRSATVDQIDVVYHC